MLFSCAFSPSRPSRAEEFQQEKPELNVPCWLWFEKSRVLACEFLSCIVSVAVAWLVTGLLDFRMVAELCVSVAI